jgi:hypothetical protein
MSTSQGSTGSDGSAGRPRRAAGAFDIRTFIAMLIGIYGLVLIAMGLFSTSDSDLVRSDDINVNLWAGIGMAVASAVLITWAMLRPLVVAPDTDSKEPKGSESA